MGFDAPPEARGGHVLTLSEVDDLTNYLIKNGGEGAFLGSLLKPGSTAVNPQTVSSRVCQLLGLGDCTAPLAA
jgi:hypothetical protein